MTVRTGLGVLLLAFLLLITPASALAAQIRIAVASNFASTLEQIVAAFTAESGHEAIISSGSTGKHYAQIRHGAPFDVFLAADVRRPGLLEKQGLAVPGSRRTYAIGKLVLWSPKPGYVDASGEILERPTFRHLALANPRLAPYGRAAQQVLQAKNLWGSLQQKIVRAENIGQVYQFIVSGNAELGFVARSQIMRPGKGVTGSYWEVPAALYEPIEQQAVLLHDTPAARAFLAFLHGSHARDIIQRAGYGLP